MQRRVRLIAYAITLTFLGGVVALAVPRGGPGQISVTAYFSKAIGLFKDSRVRVLGVDVGRVTSVHPEGQQVKVTMKIDPHRKIPESVHAVIVPISLIADRYIQLTPVYTSGPVLHSGSVIGVDRTSIPAELDDLLAQLKKLLDAVQSGKPGTPASIGAAIFNLAAALQGTGTDLSQTLSGAGALSGAISDNAPAIEATVTHLANLLDALGQRRDEITSLNTRLALALGAIADERTTLGSALGNIATLTEQLGSLVAAHRTDLESDLTVLAKTTSILTRHQASLAQSLDWLPVQTDGGEGHHNGGAVDFSNGPPHIDVHDAHAFACAPGLTATTCLLLGLSGAGTVQPGAAAPAATPGASGAGSAGRGASVTPSATPAPPDPANLLDLLPKVHLGDAATVPSQGPASGIRGLFDGIGGLLDHALRWFL